MTPNLAVLEIRAPHWHMPRLWLPLFLLWIPLILLSPLILLVIVGVCVAFRINPWRAIAVFWQIACSLPGTDVRVTADGTQVFVKIL
ncbi:MAG: hypothetical protein ACLQHF_08000 [Terracidiphilus sp.]